MQISQKKRKHVHFLGIGGIGVSSLARYFLSEGFMVTGSDVASCPELVELGIKIFQSHSAENLPAETDILIYSNAVLPDNPEIMEAKKRKIEVKSYPEALGEITRKYYTIAVSGTHGKSTTTAMLSLVMGEGGLDPTVIIGTKLKEFGNLNFKKGKSKYLLIEADEWKAALLNYDPNIAVITNIEEDHLDFYKDIDDIFDTFQKYITKNLQKGVLVTNADDYYAKQLASYAKGRVVQYSLKDKDASAIKLSVPGKHNIYNALASFRAAQEMGIEEKTAREGLAKFKGSWRRFEEKIITISSGKRVKIINDYAHHPTEVETTIQAVREKYGERMVVAVFQPHQHERTYRLFQQFKDVLSSLEVDVLLITDIYTVEGRESEEIKKKASSEMLCNEVEGAVFSGDIKETGNYLLKNLQGEEIVVIMGAGDIYNLESYITKRS